MKIRVSGLMRTFSLRIACTYFFGVLKVSFFGLLNFVEFQFKMFNSSLLEVHKKVAIICPKFAKKTFHKIPNLFLVIVLGNPNLTNFKITLTNRHFSGDMTQNSFQYWKIVKICKLSNDKKSNKRQINKKIETFYVLYYWEIYHWYYHIFWCLLSWVGCQWILRFLICRFLSYFILGGHQMMLPCKRYKFRYKSEDGISSTNSSIYDAY